MTPPLTDSELMEWAKEHLVCDGRMLTFFAVQLTEREGKPPDHESNAFSGL
jgi:hypothetical protein